MIWTTKLARLDSEKLWFGRTVWKIVRISKLLLT